mmetsp:Transcript_39227/g.73156  ORF Transcript_39227/g.73156 Transcript_39227/m.73156 type:complete len:212 (+) Transcript_39227:36-671(+)
MGHGPHECGSKQDRWPGAPPRPRRLRAFVIYTPLVASVLFALTRARPSWWAAFATVTPTEVDRLPRRRLGLGLALGWAPVSPAFAEGEFKGTFKEQITASKRALDKLRADECWTRVDCDGDYIRRVAGTVGVVSPLWKIKDALMELYADDPPNLPDLEDVLQHVSQLDYQAYCTIFAINGGPESFRQYMGEASNALDVCIKDFNALAQAVQ